MSILAEILQPVRLTFCLPVVPVVEVEKQKARAVLGGNVTLQCRSRAFPVSTNTWENSKGEIISSGLLSDCQVIAVTSQCCHFLSGGRVKVEVWVADQMTKMQLKITGVSRSDLTTYRCVARNILGQQEGRISLTGGGDRRGPALTKTCICRVTHTQAPGGETEVATRHTEAGQTSRTLL